EAPEARREPRHFDHLEPPLSPDGGGFSLSPGHPYGDPSMKQDNVYPIQTFLELQRLMRKFDLKPADCLSLLLDVLRSFEDAEREQEEGDGLPFPRWCYGR